MDDGSRPKRHVLYLVVSGAPAPESVTALVAACQAAGWRVVVFSTPTGTRFVDAVELERMTGEPVRSEYRMPGTGASAAPADAVLACPLTFNSVNKFAHGHADNFAVGLLCEMIGYGVPVVVVPHCKPQLPSSPAIRRSPRVCIRCAAWGCGCYSTRTRHTSAGCRRGTRSSARCRSRLAPHELLGPGSDRAADRAGQKATRPVAGRACRAGRQVRVMAVPGRARQSAASTATAPWSGSPMSCAWTLRNSPEPVTAMSQVGAFTRLRP